MRVVDCLDPALGADRRNLEGAAGVEVLEASIADERVAELVEGADLVFNVAGQVSHAASMRDPLHDLQLNAIDHAVFLETLRRVAPDARVVHTSTRQVYGRADRLPADERTAANPVDVNGVAKLAGEQLHLVYHRAYGMRTTALRLTNTYGPRQRLTSDELGVLPVFVRKALRNETIELFGDGSQIRDCLYVDDAVDALLAATDDSAAGRIYNVGHPVGLTLAEIAETVVAASGGTSEVRLVPWPDDHARVDIGSFATEGSRIAADLGWVARTSLADGMRATFAFYHQHPGYL